MPVETRQQGPDGLYPATETITWLADQAVKLRADAEEIISNPPVSMVTAFKSVAERIPDNVAIVDRSNGIEVVYTYKRYHDSIVQAAKAFIKLGLDCSYGVGIYGSNSAQWFISFMASIFAGGYVVGISSAFYSKTESSLTHRSRCQIIVTDESTEAEGYLNLNNPLPDLKAIIQYRGKPKNGLRNVYSWDEIMSMNVDDCEGEFKRRILNIAPNKCCALVATSGTTGDQKWLMLSHDSLLSTSKYLLEFLNESQTKSPLVILSHDSLCHISAMISDVCLPILSPASIVYIAHEKKTEIDAMKEVRPTIIFGTPKFWEATMDYILEYEQSCSNLKRGLFSWAREQTENNNSGPRTPKRLLTDHLLKKIYSKIGLDKCKLAITFGAPSKPNVLTFFHSLGIPLLDGYGTSECGFVTANRRSSFKIGSIGQPIDGVQLKLKKFGDDNEICISGRNVFMGYLNNELKTKQAFDEDLFYKTCDIANMDEDNFLTIIGRSSDMIVNIDGYNIYPLPIEKRIMEQMPCLSHCVVVGDGRTFLSALLVFKLKVDPATGELTDELHQLALNWCRNLEIEALKLSEIVNSKDPRINEEIQKVIDRTNELAIADYEFIIKWKILKTDFSVKGGELGNLNKLKRAAIHKSHEKEIDELY